MRYGILCAMEEEIKELRRRLADRDDVVIAGATFSTGTLNGHAVTMVESGIGKVQAGMMTAVLIDHFKVDCVINSGSAGGIGDGLKVGDVVVSTKVAYHDVNSTAFNYAPGQLPDQPRFFEADAALADQIVNAAQNVGMPVKRGLIVSGDQFISSTAQINHIKELYPDVLCSEMEGAAVGQVAHQFAVPFVVIRAMSDTGDEEASQSFDEFIIQAGKQSAQMILNLFNQAED